jgi:hypothetical protein
MGSGSARRSCSGDNSLVEHMGCRCWFDDKVSRLRLRWRSTRHIARCTHCLDDLEIPRCSSSCIILFPGRPRGLARVRVSASPRIDRDAPDPPFLPLPSSAPLRVQSRPSRSTALRVVTFPNARHSKTYLIGQINPCRVIKIFDDLPIFQPILNRASIEIE